MKGPPEGWFPPGFRLIGWLLVGAYAYLHVMVVPLEPSVHVGRLSGRLASVAATLALWGGPIWLVAAPILAFGSGRPGLMRERLLVVLILVALVTYLVISYVLD